MKYKIWKKLAIGLSAAMATSIPAVFITSCGVKPQPKPEPEYQWIQYDYFKQKEVDSLLKYYNKQKYINWETGEVETNKKFDVWTRDEQANLDHIELNQEKPIPDGISLIKSDSTLYQVLVDPSIYNMKLPHDEFTISFRQKESISYKIRYQEITVPAYDGMGKSIGNWSSDGNNNLIFPWMCGHNNTTNKYECEGPWHLDDYGRTHYIHIDEDVLCSTRIISLPANTSHILPGAFDIQEERKMQCYDSKLTKRPACSKAFHEYVFGTFEHPETGLWQHLVFEGDVVPIANIGKKAFFRCYSLQKDLAKYYGDYLAEQMVRYGM